jgi:type II secretory pathway component GspD/PulD (secretin)
MLHKTGHGHKYAASLIFVFILVTLGGMALPAGAGSQTIQRIEVANLADTVQIKVSASAPIAMHESRIGGEYLVFDLYGRLDPDRQKRVTINSSGVRAVKWGLYRASPPVVRIAVSTTGRREYSLDYNKNKSAMTIVVNKAGKRALRSSPKPEAPAASPHPCVSPEPTPEPVAEPVSTVSAPEIPAEPAAANPTEPVSAPVTATAEPEAPVTAPSPPAVSAEAPPPVEVKPLVVASIEPMVAQPARAVAAATPRQSLVSLDFVASDIHDVLKGLAMQGGVNVVGSADLKGDVTVSLSNVTVEEALRLVTNLSGYKYAKVDGAYVVGTTENLRSLGSGNTDGDGSMTTDIVIIKYADPAVTSKMIETQFSNVKVTTTGGAGDSKTAVPKGPTFLALAGSSSAVQAAKAMVEGIEKSVAASNSASSFEIYEVKYADINELAGLLASAVPGLRVVIGPTQGFKLQCPTAVAMGSDAGGYSGGTNAASEASKAPAKTLILEGAPQDLERAKQFLAKVDVPQPQIVIEAKVVDLTNDAAKDLGIEWTWPGNAGEPGNTVTLSERRFDADHKPIAVNPLGHLRRVENELFAKISALVENGRAKVLANPNVASLDGKPASIFIGDEVKYVSNIQQTVTGVNVTTETVRVGVQLHCISRISTDGYITMNLHPEVSVITRFIDTPAGLSLPEVSRRFVDTTIRVKDGETIVIGGLIRDEEIETMSGIPFLKDLPIIGALFRSKSTSRQHSEVMMFITPRILTAS